MTKTIFTVLMLVKRGLQNIHKKVELIFTLHDTIILIVLKKRLKG